MIPNAAAQQTITYVNGQTNSGAITISQATNPATLTIATGSATQSGVISDAVGSVAGRVIKSGSGTLTLTAANTYTGTTTINAGTLAIGAGGLIGHSSGINLASGSATFDLSAAGDPLLGNLSGVAGSVVNVGAYTPEFAQTGSATFAGIITGAGGFEKGGAGTLNLTGASTYTGNTILDFGTLAVQGASAAIGTPSSPVLTMNVGYLSGDNASLLIANGGHVNSEFSAVGDFDNTTGKTTVTGLNANGTPSTWNAGFLDVGGFPGATGTLNIQNGGQVNGSRLAVLDGGNIVASGVVNGTNSRLSFTQDFSIAGTVTIQDGAEASDTVGEITTGSVTVTGEHQAEVPSDWINTNALEIGVNGLTARLSILNGGLVKDVTGIIGDGQDSSSPAAGSATVSGVSPTGTPSTWDHQGTVLYVGYYGGVGVLNIQDGGQVIDYNGMVGWGAGSTGTAIVSGINANGTASKWANGGVFEVGFGGAGTLTIQDGGIVTDYGTVLANSGTATVNLNSNGVLQTGYIQNFGTTTTPAINFNGGIVRATASTIPGYNFLFSGCAITLGISGGTIDNNGFSVTNESSLIGGSGGLTSTGSGTFLLTGANTYTGGTNVNGGTLRVSGASALGSTSGTLTVNTGGTLDLNGASPVVGTLNGTGGILNGGTGTAASLTLGYPNATGGNFAGTIKDNSGIGGTVALVKVGSGTQMLTGTNTFTGGTTIGGGAIEVQSDAGLGGLPTMSNPGVGAIILTGSGELLTDAVGGFSTSRAITINGSGSIAAVTGTTATYQGTITGGTLAVGDGTHDGAVSFSHTASVTGGAGVDGGPVYGGGGSIAGTAGAVAVTVTGSATLGNAGTVAGGAGGSGGDAYRTGNTFFGYGGWGGNGATGVAMASGAGLTNSGSISGGDGGIGGTGIGGGFGGTGGAGIDIGTQESAINYGAISGGHGGLGGAGASGSAGGAGGLGVNEESDAKLTNFGTITGGTGGVGSYGYGAGAAGGGGIFIGSGSTFSNEGLLTGGRGGNGNGQGGNGGGGGTALVVGPTSTLNNTGTIRGGVGGTGSGSALSGAGGAGGLAMELGAGSHLTNSGLIAGGAAGGVATGSADSDPGGLGIMGYGNSLIINSGTITGGVGDGYRNNAIQVNGGGNTVELYPTSHITGDVISYSPGTDTLALGGTGNGSFEVSNIGPSPTTLGSPNVGGYQYQGFGLYAKVGTGTWTLTGQPAMVTGGTLTLGGGTTVSLPSGPEVTPWTISQGVLSIASDDNLGNVSGTLTLNGGTLRTTANLTSLRNVTVTANRGVIDTDGKGVTLSGIISGAGGITLRDSVGTGLLVLNGVDTYLGATTVAAGTLSVTGSITSSAVTVSSGAALGGTGRTGAVTLSAGANLDLRDQKIGTLTIGKLTTGNTATPSVLSFDIQTVSGTTTVDKIIDQGTLTLGGTGGTKIYIDALSGTSALENSINSYALLTYAGAQQSLGNLSLATTSLDGKKLSLHQTGDTVYLDVEGKPSLYFQNGTTLGILTLASTFLPESWQGIGTLNSGWKECSIADVNGDGIDDIFFQNGSALGALILDASGNPASWLNLGVLNAGWRLRGAAKLTDDGQLDLLIQNGTALGLIELNDAGLPVSYNLIGVLGAGWQLHAVADLNGDGQPELLFQNGTAVAALQLGTNGLPVAWHPIGALSAGWILSDAADIDGDGQPELIFQNGTALGALQVSTAFAPQSWHPIGGVGSGWTLPGDY